MFEPVKFKEITLERLNMGLRHIISRSRWKDIQTNFFWTEMEYGIVAQISAYMIGKQQEKILKFEFPKTWKDHFKMKYRSKWWMRRWLKKHPIKLVSHKWNVNKFTSFPDFIIPSDMRDKRHFVFFESEPLEMPKW